MKRRIIVTGAAGFIGHHLCNRLKEQGYWVRGVDWKDPEYGLECDEFLKLDLRYRSNCIKAFSGKFDEAWLLAADMGGMGFIQDPNNQAKILYNNTMIDFNSLEECRLSGIKKILYSSSACIYPNYKQKTTDCAPLKESDAYPSDPQDCLSEDTEVMTKFGFKQIKDITLEDDIATLSQKGYLEYNKPTHKQILNHNGTLIHFKSKYYDCLVTPRHKLAVSKKRGEELERIEASKFVKFQKIEKGYFKRNCSWLGVNHPKIVEISPVLFEKSKDKQNRGNRIKHGMKFNIEDYLKFVGWFITEGSCGFYGGKNYITQIRQCNKENLKSIIHICENMGLKVQKSSYENERVIINSKSLFTHLKEFGHGAINKRLLSWILDLDSNKLRILFNTMMLGDGSTKNNKMIYCTSSPFLRDQFVEIALKVGYAASVSTIPKQGNINERYRINLSKQGIHKVSVENISYEQYSGIVYDLTVPNHIFYIRRKGKHLWTGNSYGNEKLIMEKLCESYRNYGTDIKVVRFHNVYGPEGTYKGGREKAPAALCRKVIIAIKNECNFIEVWGDGEQTRSFCYIDDCLKALELVMNSDIDVPINIGRDDMLSINQLSRIIQKVAGVELYTEHIDGPLGVRGRNSDNTMFKNKFNWQPEISMREGLAKTYKWIERQIDNETD